MIVVNNSPGFLVTDVKGTSITVVNCSAYQCPPLVPLPVKVVPPRVWAMTYVRRSNRWPGYTWISMHPVHVVQR